MKNLILNNPLNGEFKPVKDDDGTASGLSLAHNKVKAENLEIRNLSGSINFDEELTIASSGDINLDTDGGQVYIKDGGTNHFMFDCDGTRFRIYDDTDISDTFTINVGANGVTGLLTNDNDGTAGHLQLIPDGDLVLDPASTKIIINATDDLFFDGGSDTYITESTADNLKFVVGGDSMLILSESSDTIQMGATNWIAGTVSGGTVTEFSATNSSYAGMILGYTRLEGDLSGQEIFEIQNSMTVEDAAHKVVFKTPPSENVEIEACFTLDITSTDTRVTIGLSDSSTYNAKAVKFEYDNVGAKFSDDEADDAIVVVKWVLNASDLEAIGVENTFWIGFSTAGITKTAYLRYGVRATHGIADAPMIIKATALPATIYDGS